MTWPRSESVLSSYINILGSCFMDFLLLFWKMPFIAFRLTSYTFVNIILSRPNSIAFNSCVTINSIYILRLYQFSLIIFFISEYIIMWRNRRSIGIFGPRYKLPLWFRTWFFWPYPRSCLGILAWSWSNRLVFSFFLIKPFYFGSESVKRFIYWYPKLF